MRVSRLCLGTMTFSRATDETTAALVVNEALDAGINFIDTAESYGESEEFLGRILTGKRDRVYLATKVFRRIGKDGRIGRNSRGNMIESLERSLRLLQTDHVDLFQLHHPDDETPIDETLSTLDHLIKQGKTRYVGVTNHYAWQTAHMVARAQTLGFDAISSTQIRYNILDRPAEIETLPMAGRFGLAVMTYAPLCGGMLSGKYHRGEITKSGTRSVDDKKLQELLKNEKAFDVIEQLNRIAQEQSLQLNQLAILWLLGKPQITTQILGGSRPEHFREIYTIVDRTLDEQMMRQIDEISASFVYRAFENQPIKQGAPI